MAQAESINRDKSQSSGSRSRDGKNRRLALAFAAAGGVSFWLPDVIIHANAGPNLDARHAWAITVIAPVTFLAAYLVTRRLALKRRLKMVGPTMFVGVWLSSGLFMTIGAILSRSEFIGGTGWVRLVPIIISIIPIVTYILAAYDGSLFALLAITVGALLILGFRSSVALWTSARTANNVEENKSRAA